MALFTNLGGEPENKLVRAAPEIEEGNLTIFRHSLKQVVMQIVVVQLKIHLPKEEYDDRLLGKIAIFEELQNRCVGSSGFFSFCLRLRTKLF